VDQLTLPTQAAPASDGVPFSIGIVIPVFDHETAVVGVVDALEASGLPCFLVDDGSSETCRAALERISQARPSWVTLLRLPVNRGKGAAVMAGVRAAYARGLSHVLQVDADGQHDLGDLPELCARAALHPRAVICGAPRFDDSIPIARKYGRLLTSVWVWINSLSLAIDDPMCGYRVYPLDTLVHLLDSARLGQRMDFDPEVLVRLSWAGLAVVNVPTRVRYPADGRSHFRMLRDNWLISVMHTRLFFGMLPRAPGLLARRLSAAGQHHRTRGAGRQEGSPVPSEHAASTHWSAMSEVGSRLGLLISFWLYKLLGRRPFQAVLLPIVLYFFLFKAEQRRASRQFLRRCYEAGGLPRAPGSWATLRHFFHFGQAVLDKLVAYNGGIPIEDVVFRGEQEVQAVLDGGRGALLLGSHLGNLEICRALARFRPGLRLRVLVHTRHAQNFNRLLARLDPKSQVSLQQVTELGVPEAAELAAWVAGGGMVLIAADRVPLAAADSGRAGRVIWADFLRHPAPFPQGPFILGGLLDCPVFSLFCVRRGARFEATFEPFATRLALPRSERERVLQRCASSFAAQLERHCLAAPLQWFNFFPFWSQGQTPSSAGGERHAASTTRR
jgi:predicted LPLAT superfamily acyltransferase